MLRLPQERRSIPAGAGEPAKPVARTHVKKVYPRGCGGTFDSVADACVGAGLSPRVRGNLVVNRGSYLGCGSIPAGAGEPSVVTMCMWATPVYPRGCGGTYSIGARSTANEGLSPRVRGNLQQPYTAAGIKGSIPAVAGEPRLIHCRRSAPTVYPRGCGGTDWGLTRSYL